MKHMKTEVVPAATREVVDRVTCDLCGSDIVSGNYDADEVVVAHKTGNNYPESGSGKETSVDLCGKCFQGKLVPWLRSQGAEPRSVEWKY